MGWQEGKMSSVPNGNSSCQISNTNVPFKIKFKRGFQPVPKPAIVSSRLRDSGKIVPVSWNDWGCNILDSNDLWRND